MNAVTQAAAGGGAFSSFPTAIAQLAHTSSAIVCDGEAEFRRNADLPPERRQEFEQTNHARQKAVDLSLLHLYPTSLADAAVQLVIASGYFEGLEPCLPEKTCGLEHRAIGQALNNIITFLDDNAEIDISKETFGEEILRGFSVARANAAKPAPSIAGLLPSPDQPILDAFEEWKKAGAITYLEEVPDEENKAAALRVTAAEDIIRVSEPRTIAGVIPKLLICIPRLDESRWVERSIVTDQIDRLVDRQDELEGWVAGCVLDAVAAMRKMAASSQVLAVQPLDDGQMWAAVIARYEAEDAAFKTVLDDLGRAEQALAALPEDQRKGSPEEAAVAAAHEAEDKASERHSGALADVDCTHPPTLEALAQKVRIMTSNGTLNGDDIVADILEFLA